MWSFAKLFILCSGIAVLNGQTLTCDGTPVTGEFSGEAIHFALNVEVASTVYFSNCASSFDTTLNVYGNCDGDDCVDDGSLLSSSDCDGDDCGDCDSYSNEEFTMDLAAGDYVVTLGASATGCGAYSLYANCDGTKNEDVDTYTGVTFTGIDDANTGCASVSFNNGIDDPSIPLNVCLDARSSGADTSSKVACDVDGVGTTYLYSGHGCTGTELSSEVYKKNNSSSIVTVTCDGIECPYVIVREYDAADTTTTAPGNCDTVQSCTADDDFGEGVAYVDQCIKGGVYSCTSNEITYHGYETESCSGLSSVTGNYVEDSNGCVEVVVCSSVSRVAMHSVFAMLTVWFGALAM